MKHREEFKDTKLADNLSNSLDYYHYEKISVAIYGKNDGVFRIACDRNTFKTY